MQLGADDRDGRVNLLGSIGARMVRTGQVVGADVEHDPAGCKSIKLTLAQPPEDILGSIPAETEIKHRRIPKSFCHAAGPFIRPANGWPPRNA